MTPPFILNMENEIRSLTMTDKSLTLEDIKAALKDMSTSDKAVLRDQINIELTGSAEDRVGSADVDADDEKKKYIAQHGDPNAQRRAQDVPEPVAQDIKDLQDEKAEEEHQAAGRPDTDEAKEKELA